MKLSALLTTAFSSNHSQTKVPETRVSQLSWEQRFGGSDNTAPELWNIPYLEQQRDFLASSNDVEAFMHDTEQGDEVSLPLQIAKVVDVCAGSVRDSPQPEDGRDMAMGRLVAWMDDRDPQHGSRGYVNPLNANGLCKQLDLKASIHLKVCGLQVADFLSSASPMFKLPLWSGNLTMLCLPHL
jgi:hypothetical protein